MKHDSIIVRAEWDEDAHVWTARSTDIAGLAVEAASLEALNTKVLDAITDLVELNGVESDLSEIPVRILADRISLVPNRAR